MSPAVREILEREGIQLRLNAKCIGVRARRRRRRGARRLHGGRARGHGLPPAARGRPPAEHRRPRPRPGRRRGRRARLHRGRRRSCRTNVPGIWALGDCNGRGAFTHTSYNDFEIVAANLLDSDPRRVSDRIPAYALYIDPPLGRAGMTEAEVRASGRPALVGDAPDVACEPRDREGRDPGLHEDPGRPGDASGSSARASSARAATR